MLQPVRNNILLLILIFSVALLIFIADILYNHNTILPVLYVAPVLMSLFSKKYNLTLYISILVSLFTIATFVLSNKNIEAQLNIAIAFTGIWIAYYFIQRFKNAFNNEARDRERLNALFQYATEGIIITNDRGEIKMINPIALKQFGYKEEELMNQPIEILVPTRFTGSHVQHRKNFSKDPKPRPMGKGSTLFAKRKDDSEFPIAISLSSFKTSEGKFIIAFVIDITERRKSEEQILKLNEDLEKRVHQRTDELGKVIKQLEETNKELALEINDRKEVEKQLEYNRQELRIALEKEKELGELKSRFVTMASHEFRTPLSTILSSASLISQYADNSTLEKRNKHISRIKSSVHNLTSILNDFLSLGKLEEGRIICHPSDFDITNFSNDLIGELNELTKSGQRIEYHHSGNNVLVHLDNNLTRNICFNLLSNAIKYSAENTTIKFNTTTINSHLMIDVTDSGIGIPGDEQQHIFERFFRANNASNIQGTGLGLNIVKKYVELMGGEVTFTSAPGSGTTFKVKLPVSLSSQ